MSDENNFGEKLSEDTIEKSAKKNVLLKGWNEFIKNITDGFNTLQKAVESNVKGNDELWKQNKDKFFKFFEDMGDNWETQMNKWSKDIEETVKIDAKDWEENKDQFADFVTKTKSEWDSKIQQWVSDLEKKKIEN
ncbi:MAG: hypothetical protein ACFFKA_15260, partial [Candidatus Thorarchaeota archaeon]